MPDRHLAGQRREHMLSSYYNRWFSLLLASQGYLLMVVQMGPDSWGGGVLQDVFVVLPVSGDNLFGCHNIYLTLSLPLLMQILSYIIARSWNDHVRGSYSAVYHHCGAMGTEVGLHCYLPQLPVPYWAPVSLPSSMSLSAMSCWPMEAMAFWPCSQASTR